MGRSLIVLFTSLIAVAIWCIPVDAVTRAAGTASGSSTPTPAQIGITREGVYRLSYSYLKAHHFGPKGIVRSRLGISDAGQSIPIYVAHSGSGSGLGPSDFIEFYAHPVDNTYTSTNVYVLSDDGSSVRRVKSVTAPKVPSGSTTGGSTYSDTSRSIRDAMLLSAPNYTTDLSWPTLGDATWRQTDLVTLSSRPTVADAIPFSLHHPVLSGTCSIAVPVIGIATGTAAPSPEHQLSISINGEDVTNSADGTSGFTWETPPGQTTGSYIANGAFPCSALTSSQGVLTYTSNLQKGTVQDEVLPQAFTISYRKELCADSGNLAWQAGQQAFNIGGFANKSIVVWQVGAETGARISPPKGALGKASVCTRAGYGTSFPDAGSRSGSFFASSNPLTPSSLGPVDFTSITRGSHSSAQFLIITNPAFEHGIQPLAKYHRNHGLTVKVVSVNTIYAQYRRTVGHFTKPHGNVPGDGLVNPDAIRAYIGYAHANLGTKFVLLVGGDTFDYHNHFGCPDSGICGAQNPNNLSFIPSLVVQSRYAGLVSSDNLYAVPEGSSNLAPDVAIGRLPVLTQAQLATEVDKSIHWSSRLTGPGGYSGTATFSAGFPSPIDYGAACGDPTFESSSDLMASRLPNGFHVTRAYEDGKQADDAVTRQGLLNQFNSGREIVNFVGHGNLTQWSCSPALLSVPDIGHLTNSGRPSMVFQWGCQATDFAEPRLPNMDSALLNATDGHGAPVGAVLALGSSGEDLAIPQAVLAGGTSESGPTGVAYFYGYLSRGLTVGQSLQLAKDDMVSLHPDDVDYIDVINSYTILGDPALKI